MIATHVLVYSSKKRKSEFEFEFVEILKKFHFANFEIDEMQTEETPQQVIHSKEYYLSVRFQSSLGRLTLLL